MQSSARLLQAREFHESARSLVTLGDGPTDNAMLLIRRDQPNPPPQYDIVLLQALQHCA